MRSVLLTLLFVIASMSASAQSAAEFAARARALSGEARHAEAARLFERAIEGAPRRREEWLPEYADQLAFSGSAERAIPLYREVAGDPAQPEETRELARRRLALALFWSWELEKAVPALRAVVEDYPDDEELRDALDRASAALAEANAGARRIAALQPLWNEEYSTAIPALRQLFEESPADAELRQSLADALAGAARTSLEQDHDQAVALLGEAARIDPSRATQFALQEAELLLYAGQWLEADARFRALLERSGLSSETRLAARLGLARTYAWSGRPEQAIPVYDTLLAEYPGNMSGLIGRGQALADQGDYRRALTDFDRALATEPAHPEALRGRPRATLGLQRPRDALAQLAPLFAGGEPDPGARLLAARARRSMGRPDIALDLARGLVAEGAAAEEATAFIEALLLDQMPLTVLQASHAWQSDGLKVMRLSGRHTLMFEEGRSSFGFQAGVTRFRGETFPAVDLASIGVFGSHRISDAFEARGEVLLNIRDTPDRTGYSTTFETELGYLPDDAWRFGLGWNRRFAGDTSRAIAENVVADDFSVAARFSPAPEFRAGARATWTRVSGSNRRISAEIDASRRVLSGTHQVWLGARAATFAYDRTSDDYWSPLYNNTASVTLQALGPIEGEWRYGVNGSLGYSRSALGSEGATYGLGAQISRPFSEAGSIALTASHVSSLARSGGAGGNDRQPAWSRSELGVTMRLRF